MSDEEKLVIVDGLKSRIADRLASIAENRLGKLPLADWQAAYGLRGSGTTVTRRHKVRSIFHAQVPVPESRSDRASEAWMEEIENVVAGVVKQLQEEAQLVAEQ